MKVVLLRARKVEGVDGSKVLTEEATGTETQKKYK